ncbi:MAG TPA: M1 family aminopeptidase [Longimicrobiales bacterium]|nr:M1 family aminopeptidase [Longimicrobiales bacterium]
MTSWLILATAMMLQQGPEFHQGVDYTVEAVLDSSTHVLRGRERIRYVNKSSAKIDTIWFHLHLNAFRPNSAWAQRELQFNSRRFQDLGPDDHAYERIRSVRVGGRPVRVVYPGAPDSTVMGVPLPTPLNPGMSVSLLIDWSARLSTLPRRQGRRDHHYDFAQWYPRVAVYDRGGWQVQPLLPQGEFYGEFATYDVTLEVPKSFVVGATGVPVNGDPGWEAANITQANRVEYRRDAYDAGPVEALGLFDRKLNARHKRIQWRAEQVHHFAWTTNPQYVYEGGKAGNTLVHALFLPSDSNWAGAAVQRTVRAIQFLESIFGPYVYPQITNVHRVEGGGGTEFPMMIMDASSNEGLIVHEIAHQWAHAMLGNNEWKDGWLDEGMASFVGNLYAEAAGQKLNYAAMSQGVARFDTAAATRPIATPSADFQDMQSYSVMTYSKPALVFRMLQHLLGDAVFRTGMKRYYQENKLEHVDEQDFKEAMEEVSGQDLDWFFQQWLHTNHTLDYAVSSAATVPANGKWRTRVEVTRSGQAWMPVELKVGDVVQRLDSRESSFSVTVETTTKPTEVVIDPNIVLIDLDRQNNLKVISN